MSHTEPCTKLLLKKELCPESDCGAPCSSVTEVPLYERHHLIGLECQFL